MSDEGSVRAVRLQRGRYERVVQATWLGLVALALALFVGVRSLPDWTADRSAIAPNVEPATGIPVQDFAYIFNYARRAVHRPGVSPYSMTEHRAFLTEWLGAQVSSALCFAYTPTTILMLSPLLPLPTTWAWLAWNLLGVTAATAVVHATAARSRHLLTIGCLSILSPAVFYCLVLGQTALVTTALLGAIVLRPGEPRRWRSTLAASVCLLALTMKPPLALVGAAALLGAGRWRAVAAAAAMGLPLLVAALAWWGSSILGDYVALVSHYNLAEAPPLIRMGFHPQVMSNLRNVLLHTGRFDDAQASDASYLPLMIALAIPGVLALLRRAAIPVAATMAWTCVAYGLFSPHLTPAEDVLLAILPLWLWPFVTPAERTVLVCLCVGLQFAGASTFALFSLTSRLPTLATYGPLAAFATKLVIAALAGVGLARAATVPQQAVTPADPT